MHISRSMRRSISVGGMSRATSMAILLMGLMSHGGDVAGAESRRGSSASIDRGVRVARVYCARCHAIDRLSPSPLAMAPPFRDLHKSYPVDQLEEPLAEGLVTGHPSMPEFRFDPGQINDFIAYLKSLE
jgi:cytochrome c